MTTKQSVCNIKIASVASRPRNDGIRTVCLAMTFIFSFLSFAFCAEIQYAKVLDTSGTVEVLVQPHRRWMKLEKNAYLSKGTSVRTHANSGVWMAFDPEMETLAELGENSYLNVWTGPPSRVSLKNGRLYVFRESETAGIPFKILTPEFLVQVPAGGVVIDASNKGSLLNVFAENAVITIFSKAKLETPPKKIEEGFKFFSAKRLGGSAALFGGKKASNEESFYERMKYAEYAMWKAWVEKMYELKDDFAADVLEKELGQ